MTFKPLLAGKAPENLSQLSFPVLASPKLDGIRCVKLNGKALTRTLKPIPNDFVRTWVEKNLPDGIDGELLLRANLTAPFAEVSSAIMNRKFEPDFTFAAFDWIGPAGANAPFEQRFEYLRESFHDWSTHDFCDHILEHAQLVPHTRCMDVLALSAIVGQHMEQGYEGTMIRSPGGRYKMGRSSTNEGILLKIKQFEDEEAIVTGTEEELENTNEKAGVGIQKRSTRKEGMVPKGRIGRLLCTLLSDDTQFAVGSGLTDELKAKPPSFFIGQTIKVKYQPPPGGRKPGEAPRFPVFLGFRDETDR